MSTSLPPRTFDLPPYPSLPAAPAHGAEAHPADEVDAEPVVVRVNAYGLDADGVAHTEPKRKRLRRIGGLAAWLNLVVFGWLCYFVVTAALRLNVWPF